MYICIHIDTHRILKSFDCTNMCAWLMRYLSPPVPSGNDSHSYQKPPCLIGKSTLNGPFSIAILNYQRIYSFIVYIYITLYIYICINGYLDPDWLVSIHRCWENLHFFAGKISGFPGWNVASPASLALSNTRSMRWNTNLLGAWAYLSEQDELVSWDDSWFIDYSQCMYIHVYIYI